MILYMLHMCIIIKLILRNAIIIKLIKQYCIKHKNTHFRRASQALTRARPGGLFWAPPRRSPKSHFLGYQQLLYITCNHYVDYYNAVTYYLTTCAIYATIHLRTRALLLSIPTGPTRGCSPRASKLMCVVYTLLLLFLYLVDTHYMCVCNQRNLLTILKTLIPCL